MNLDQQRLCIELQHLDWAHQLKEEVIQDIAASATLVEFQAGQVVFELDSEINSLYFVVAGRLEGALFDRLGKEIVHETFQRGSVVGLFSVLLADRSHLHVEAVEHTSAIRLGLDCFASVGIGISPWSELAGHR
jgi:CRP-like cAMP-binding protein